LFADDLIATARALADGQVPGDGVANADLRRAVSTAYYALFHAVCAMAADALVGRPDPHRPERAWQQAYRALEHGKARQRLLLIAERTGGPSRFGFPEDVAYLATTFSELQHERHRADYDPMTRLTAAEAMRSVRRAEVALIALRGLERPHRVALAVWLLLDRRP